MKYLSAICAALSVAAIATTWKYVEPLISQNGSSVISIMKDDGKVGGNVVVKIPNNLTTKQHSLLNFAYQVAKNDGYKYPQLLQGILMQETMAGNMKSYRVAGLENKFGDRYFGLLQIKISAAMDVMKNHPELWKYLDTRTEEELQARLVLDDEFNIRVGSKYALLMGINQNSDIGITSYNRGAGGAKLVNPSTHHYTVKVKAYGDQFKNIK